MHKFYSCDFYVIAIYAQVQLSQKSGQTLVGPTESSVAQVLMQDLGVHGYFIYGAIVETKGYSRRWQENTVDMSLII